MSRLARLLGHDRKPAGNEVPPMFNVVPATDTAPAEILFYGDVFEETPRSFWTGEPVEGLHISLEDMVTRIEELRDASEILIRLNSSGGDLFAGITLHNILKGLSGHKTVRVEGLAASAASLIMCAGDTVKVYPSSMVMVHNACSVVWDDLTTQDVRELLAMHEKAEASMVKIYAAKTGRDEDELQALIDSTTWMLGQDAIDQGFADELIEDAYEEGDGEEPIDPDLTDKLTPQVSADGHFLMVAGVRHSLAGIDKLPAFLAASNPGFRVAEAAGKYKADRGQDAHDEQKEDVLDNITTVAQLREAYPDLVASIETDAVQNERTRLLNIDSIASKIADADMVAKARFDEPKTAEALLMEAAQSDKLYNAAFLNATQQDADESNADDVDSNPAEDDDEDPANKEEDEFVALASRLYNKGGRK